MDDNENPTQLQSVGIGASEKARSVLSACSEDMSLCSEDNNCYIHAQPIIDVTWRGGFEICKADGNGKIHGLKAHLSNKACSKVWDVAVKIPELLSVEIVPRLNTWPKSFSESPPTDENIGIYIFPEDESHEQAFNNLLDDNICGDLALKSVVDDSELLLFTSLQLPVQHRRFQGKIYLWGVFKGKSSPASYQLKDHLSVQSASVNLGATAMESNGTGAEGTNDGVFMPTEETNAYIVWEHGMRAGRGVTCKYCSHVYYGKGRVARFKKHLAGGCPKWHVKGCPNVPREVEEAMRETLKEQTKKLQEIGVSKELQGGNQRFKMGKRSILGESHFKETTRLCESDYAVYLADKTVPGSTTVPPEQGPGGGARRIRVKPRCNCCVTSEAPPKRRNRNILSSAATTLNTNLDVENVQSEVRHVDEEELNHKVAKKAKKVRRRSTKSVKGMYLCEGITTVISTSNLLPAEKGAEPQILAPESTPNSTSSPAIASRLATPTTVSAHNVRSKPSQLGTTSVPQGGQTILPLLPFLVQQHPPEPQILAPEDTQNSTSTPVVAEASAPIVSAQSAVDKASQVGTTNVPQGDPLRSLDTNNDHELPSEKILEPQVLAPENITISTPVVLVQKNPFTQSTVSAENVGDKASPNWTTSVPPQGDHLVGLSTNDELSDQSTDVSFLDIVNAANELAESTGTDSEHAPVMQVGPYTVKHNLGQTLQAIFGRYGDIAQGSPIPSTSGRSRFLGELCEALNQLRDIQIAGCRRHHLKALLAAVETAESVGLNVSWLHQRYDDLVLALKGIKNYTALESELAKNEAVAGSKRKSLDLKKAETMRLQSEVEALNSRVASLRAENEDIERKMRSVRQRAKRFSNKRDLADGLL